jgi:hypothetical protein
MSAPVAAAFAVASAAQAAVVVSASNIDEPLPSGQILVYDFDGLSVEGFSLAYAGAIGVFDGADGPLPGLAVPPPGTTSNYLAIQAGGSASLSSTVGFRQLSVYMSSPEAFNSIRFIGLNGFDVALSGPELAAGAFDGDPSAGRRMTYDFGGDVVTQVVFSSGGASFELDNIAVAPAPEPATWALLIVGFGLAGARLRRDRRGEGGRPSSPSSSMRKVGMVACAGR